MTQENSQLVDNTQNQFSELTSCSELNDLVAKRLKQYKGAFADNTNVAVRSDYNMYQIWCDSNNLRPLPLDKNTVVAFLEDMSTTEKTDNRTKLAIKKAQDSGLPYPGREITHRSPATLSRYLASLKLIHDISLSVMQELTTDISLEYKNPIETQEVKLTMRRIRRENRGRAQKQADPIGFSTLETIISNLDDESIRHTQYKALISVAFDTLLRRSELVLITVSDLSINENGSGTVFLHWHKTDQEGKGSYRYISENTVNYIKEWLERSGISSGRLFRSFLKNDVIHKQMPPRRVAEVFKEIAAESGIPYEHISGHSTRVGAAQELLGEGSSIAELMLAGGWKSEVMPVQYGSKIASEKGAMAKFYNNRIEEKTAK